MISILVFSAIMYKFGARPFLSCMFFCNTFLYMSSVCLADVQDFWILLWIVFFTICIMITACLEVSNSHLQLFDVIV